MNGSRSTRRAAGLAGLLAAVAIIVAGKAVTAPPTRHVVLAPPAAGTGATGATAGPGVAAGAGSSARSTTRTGRFVGPVKDTRYGPVQVAVVLSAGHITDVQALQLPSAAAHSQELSGYAGPLLRQEVVQAQSAQIDTVSGASFTSDGYARSVQAALDAAHA